MPGQGETDRLRRSRGGTLAADSLRRPVESPMREPGGIGDFLDPGRQSVSSPPIDGVACPTRSSQPRPA